MEGVRSREVKREGGELKGLEESRKEKVDEAVRSINSNVPAKQTTKEAMGANSAEAARRIADNINANLEKKKK